MKPMPQATAAGIMSRTRSPLAILSPPTCVDSHAVVMIPRGLPTTKATISAMTSGEANNSGLIDSKCTPVANKAKMGRASSAENGWSLLA